MLPGVAASVVVDAAKAHMPHLPVLYTSGYASDASLEAAKLLPEARVLRKPYALEELASRVRLSIDGDA